MGLNKELWIPEILEGFYPSNDFLTEASNYDAFVSGNTLHLAEAGVDPDVLVNNAVYPVPFAQRTDTPLELPLDTFDTEGTVVRNAELAELAYDKTASVIAGHRNALRLSATQRAAHNFAPASDASFTPVLATTGANDGAIKRMSFDDIFKLQNRFDLMNIPQEGRILVLNPLHSMHLHMEDATRLRAIMSEGRVLGFKVYVNTETPRYNNTTGAKVAFGAAPAGTDAASSVAFHKDEVCRAMGTVDMFERLRDPEQKGDIINFQMRFIALPKRSKAIGAIYTAASA